MVGALLTISILASGLSAASGRAPLLPWWIADGVDISDRVALRQNVTFTGSGIRLCRILINQSDADLVINRLLVGGHNRNQLTSYLFDTRGDMIVSRRSFGHGAYVFPMTPAGPDDTSPYQVVEPNGSVGDCEDIELPPGRLIQIVSAYRSDLDADQVPAHLRQNRTVVARHQFVLSGVCLVRPASRAANCTDGRRWTVEVRRGDR